MPPPANHMVAASMWWFRPVLVRFSPIGLAEFSAPDDQGFVEETALFQVDHEGGGGLVDLLAEVFKIFFERFTGAAVAVPACVIELDEAHAALDEAAGEQAVVGEGGFAGLPARKGQEVFFALSGKVGQFRGAGLHAVGHFVLADAGGDFGIAGGDESFEIKRIQGVDRLFIARRVDSGGTRKIDDWAAAGRLDGSSGGNPELVDCAPPRAARARLEDDEAGEIFLHFGADAVGDRGPGMLGRPNWEEPVFMKSLAGRD